jgi:hemerythrin-like domain-containing protein
MPQRTSRRTPTRRTTSRAAAGQSRTDAIAALKADHRKVEGLFSQLEKTSERGASKRTRLVGQIETEIKMHMRLEEEIFYPAFREAVTKKDDKELYHEAREEHHTADMVLKELKALDPSDETFGAKAKVLKELIEHHVEEEENEMFPKARRAMGATLLKQLGDEMMERKRSLQSMDKTAVGRIARTVMNV